MVDPNREIHIKLPEDVRAASVEVVILFDEHAGPSKVEKRVVAQIR